MSTFLKVEDFIGKQFHYLTVISDGGQVLNGKKKLNAAVCKCKCGNLRTYSLSLIKSGRTVSCGCYSTELKRKRLTKHNLARHPLYYVWFSMLSRCEKTADAHYSDYGGRGISVCEEWHEFINFYEWAINNGYQAGLENDRK